MQEQQQNYRECQEYPDITICADSFVLLIFVLVQNNSSGVE